MNGRNKFHLGYTRKFLSIGDFQSEVGEVFGEIGGTSGEVWKEIFELLLLGKSSEAFSTKTPPQISTSNFTTRFWVVLGRAIHGPIPV